MKFLSSFIIILCAQLISSCSGGSGKSVHTGPAPAPSPHDRRHEAILKLESKLEKFELLLNDYTSCVSRKSEAACSAKADLLNNFSFVAFN